MVTPTIKSLRPYRQETAQQMMTHNKDKQATAPIRWYLLFQFCISILIFSASTQATAADTFSIANDTEVTVHRAPGNEYKTLARLQNGEKITSLEESGDWVKIRTATDKEGWILKRYLSDAPSADEAFTLPPTGGDHTSEQAAAPDKSVPLGEQNLKAAPPEPKPLPPDNSHAQKQANTNTPIPPSEPEELKKPEQKVEDTNPLDLSSEEITQKMAILTQENKELREDKQIHWFLAGGGVFILGWIFGFLSSKARKRKPSLL